MFKEGLHEFRISRYNNALRDISHKNEWTSISDIGKMFSNEKLTFQEYYRVEETYLSFIREVCNHVNICQMYVSDLEDFRGVCNYSNGSMLLCLEEIIVVAKKCLREEYWCKLCSDTLSFHFGYDFYLYVRSPLDLLSISSIAGNCGLFVEDMLSPYT